MTPCDCRTCTRGDDQWCCRKCHEIAAEAWAVGYQDASDDTPLDFAPAGPDDARNPYVADDLNCVARPEQEAACRALSVDMPEVRCPCGWSDQEHDPAEHRPILPHPCGHKDRVRGCGGCDPAAVDYVIENGERLDCPNGGVPGPFSCSVPRCPCCVPPLRDELAVVLHKLFCDMRCDNEDSPCWTAWRQEADLLMLPIEEAVAQAWERGHRGCRCGRPARCHNPYLRGGAA